MWFVTIYRAIVSIFKYIEPLWIGNNKKISIRRALALYLTIDFINNTHHADVAMLLGIEAALVAGLLSLTTYSSTFLNPRQPDPYAGPIISD